jgi:hypothetical protein
MDKNFNIILSAIIAVLVYVLLIILFLVYLKNDIVKKIDTVNKTTVLQLDIVMEKAKTKEPVNIKTGIKPEKIAQKVVKKTSSVSVKKTTNLKSLFANVKTSVKKIPTKKVLNIKKSSIASRYKSKFEKEEKRKKVSLSNMIDVAKSNKPINKMVTTETNNESDPYFSQINQILSSRWNPIVFSQELQARVIVTILKDGSFRYKFINYSTNDNFNTQLEEFLKDESFKIYPANPNNKITNIEILFHTKG